MDDLQYVGKKQTRNKDSQCLTNITWKCIEMYQKRQLITCIIMSILINEYTGKNGFKRRNSNFIVLIFSIKTCLLYNIMPKYLVYSGNTVIGFLPNIKYMRENYFSGPLIKHWPFSSSSDFLFKIVFFSQLYNYHNKYWSWLKYIIYLSTHINT